MPIDLKTRQNYIRYAPGFGCVPAAERIVPYTIDAVAKFLGEAYKTDHSVLRETITATLKALGEGKIAAEEMPVAPDTRKDFIRYAPGFGCAPAQAHVTPYTVDALAQFLGEVKTRSERDGVRARDSFRAAFDALELMSEGYVTEAQIKNANIMEQFQYIIRAARANKEGVGLFFNLRRLLDCEGAPITRHKGWSFIRHIPNLSTRSDRLWLRY